MRRGNQRRIARLAISVLALVVAPALAAEKAPAPPATRPTARAHATLLVLPFENLNSASPDSWTAAAAQRNLVAELSNIPGLTTESGEAVPSDAESAIAIGQERGARYVLHGSLQSLPQQMRFTGEVLDVLTGHKLASLKATGTIDDLFDLEDTLVRQAQWAFRAPIAAQARATGSRHSSAEAAPPTITPSGPVRLGDDHPTEVTSSAAGLSAYYQSATPNDRFATQYNRYKSSIGAFDGSYYWGGYWGYPYGYGYGYGFGLYTHGVSIYGVSHP